MSSQSASPDALAELFKEISACFPKDDNYFLERLIYDGLERAAAEAPGVSYEDTMIAGRPCKWVRPDGASEKHVLLFMHGGGYTMGSPASHRKLAGHLARACNCSAISVDYRLAPEHKYPAALDDCLAVYKYLLDLGFPPEHIATAGDSAGGGLATCVPLAAMMKGYPCPAATVCLSPWSDLTGGIETTRSGTENDDSNNDKPLVTLADKYAARYLSGSGANSNDPLVSPVCADLKNIPPHWISVAGNDSIGSSGRRLAMKAREAGVEVILEVHEEQMHVFELKVGNDTVADGSVERIGKWVRQKIGC